MYYNVCNLSDPHRFWCPVELLYVNIVQVVLHSYVNTHVLSLLLAKYFYNDTEDTYVHTTLPNTLSIYISRRHCLTLVQNAKEYLYKKLEHTDRFNINLFKLTTIPWKNTPCQCYISIGIHVYNINIYCVYKYIILHYYTIMSIFN